MFEHIFSHTIALSQGIFNYYKKKEKKTLIGIEEEGSYA
jgi:hypothetical protein